VTGATIAGAPGWAQVQQTFPSKPVRIVVSNPAGSQGDVLARMIGLKLSDSWGRPVVVDNRTGAAGTLAAARSPRPRRTAIRFSSQQVLQSTRRCNRASL
jgi:tripartite-type tricarboxylate transporter receptor subunit TctC